MSIGIHVSFSIPHFSLCCWPSGLDSSLYHTEISPRTSPLSFSVRSYPMVKFMGKAQGEQSFSWGLSATSASHFTRLGPRTSVSFSPWTHLDLLEHLVPGIFSLFLYLLWSWTAWMLWIQNDHPRAHVFRIDPLICGLCFASRLALKDEMQSQMKDEGQYLMCPFIYIEMGCAWEPPPPSVCYQHTGPTSYWHPASDTYLCFTRLE